MADERSSVHAKPDGSVNSYSASSAQQIFWTAADGIGQQSVQNVLLRGKPLEDLGSIASSITGLNRPVVLISQDNGDTDYSLTHQNEIDTPRGVASSVEYAIAQNRDSSISEGDNRTAEMNNVNNVSSAIPSSDQVPLSEGANRTADASLGCSAAAVPSISAVPSTSAMPTQELALSFYQQQMMLNAQMFVQQQQTVNTLISKVDGLTKLVETKGESEINQVETGANTSASQADGNTKVRQLRQLVIKNKTHAMSDSDLQDISSDSDNGESDYEADNSDKSDTENTLNKSEEKTENSKEVCDNLKLLQELGKEFEKAEALGPKVDETLSNVVDSGIRLMIDRNLAKELCNKYKRPENCKALVVPKINKELWNTTSLAKTSKEQDRMYQTAQKYLNQGLIPLVQLIENLLKDKDAQNNFRLARDSLQLMAYAHRDLSNLRRQKLKAVVADKYKPLCNDSTPLTDNLLGDDLEKQIKTLDEMRKVAKDLTKHSRGEKRKNRSHDSHDRASKYPKHNAYGGFSGYKNKEKSSFLEKKSRYQYKPGHQKAKKNHKQ
ncbi:MAG: hypothetical protein AB2693_01045 [Candidatus Thiodiazotropha sp.]